MTKDLKLGPKFRKIDCSLWENAISERVLIVAPAMGVSRHYYKSFAKYFYSLGYSVLTIDYFGMEHRKRGFHKMPVRLCDWGYIDLTMAIDYAGDLFPGQNVYLVGHSIAGQVLPLASNTNILKAVFLVGSQNVSRYNWNGLPRLSVEIFWRLVVPFFVGVAGYLPGFAYGGKYNLDKRITLDWRRWGMSRDGLLGALPEARVHYKAITVPTKFISIDDDNLLAPRYAVAELAKSYGSPLKEHQHLGPADIGPGSIGHFGFFNSRHATLWQMVDRWYQRAGNQF